MTSACQCRIGSSAGSGAGLSQDSVLIFAFISLNERMLMSYGRDVSVRTEGFCVECGLILCVRKPAECGLRIVTHPPQTDHHSRPPWACNLFLPQSSLSSIQSPPIAAADAGILLHSVSAHRRHILGARRCVSHRAVHFFLQLTE